MYDALIEEIMKERKPFTLERSVPEQETRDLHISLLAEHVTSTLKPQVDEMRDRAEVSDTSSQPLSTAREVGGLWTEVQRRNHYSERQRDPTGADGEFQRVTTTRQLLQERDRRILVAALLVVVGLGHVLAETHDWLVVLHGNLPLR